MDNQNPQPPPAPVVNQPFQAQPAHPAEQKPPKLFFLNKIFLLVFVLMLIFVCGTGIYLYQKSKTPKCGGFGGLACPAGYACKFPDNHIPDAFGECVKEETKNISSVPTPTPDTSVSIKQYINPEYKYSLQIPPDFKEVSDSSNEQKRFRAYTSSGSSSDENGEFEAELQILTLSFDNPAVKGVKADFKTYLNLAASQSANLNGVQAIKIKNTYLDRCFAPQFSFNEGNYKYGYSTSCAGEERYVAILLSADNLSMLEKYKQSYDLAIESFKFNQFQL